MSASVGIVGGGVLGAALLHLLTDRHPDHSFTLFEKESGPGLHQTSHNSGVVHAGLYYAPGSLKSMLTRRGVELIRGFTLQHGLPYEECGKLLIATEPSQVPQLERIAETAIANGVPGIRILRTRHEIRAIEPHAVGIAALHSPTTAITDYLAITRKLLEIAEGRGAHVHFDSEVTAITETPQDALVEVDGTLHRFDRVITCTGLQSDLTAEMTGGSRFPVIVPFAGTYYTLNPTKGALVRGLIYPVPDPAYPFLGIHLTRMIDGSVTVGPDAFLAFKREGYSQRSFSVRDTRRILTTWAFWRFALQNAGAALEQVRNGSRRMFAKQSSRFVPGIEASDLLPGPRGVRAQAMRHDGTLEEDFVIESDGRITHVRNAPSPAATSSMAIAEHIADLIDLGAPADPASQAR
ncbi:MAG: L-2-hydroxyglutarate oxidase [Microterricola sp.]